MTTVFSQGFGLLGLIFLCFFSPTASNQGVPSSLQALLPQLDSWRYAESPQHYLPETLFEYINGAAESYLSYDFQELAVAQYKKEDSEASLTLEIYDMGKEKNAFGIYSAERYPESEYLAVGNQGYREEGTLNFIIADMYIKLLCFDCGENEQATLKLFAQDIEKRIKEKGALPPLLKLFPKSGLVAYSEKFILHNFLGFGFLHDGYLANYKDGQEDFDLFLIEGTGEKEAEDMFSQYLTNQAGKSQPAEKISLGYHIKDRYAQNIYLARVKNYIFGVMRIQDGREEVGLNYLQIFAEAIKAR